MSGVWSEPKPATTETQGIADKVSLDSSYCILQHACIESLVNYTHLCIAAAT